MLGGRDVTEGGDSGELPREPLCVGEAVAARTKVLLGRQARSKVRVRVVGWASLALVEAANAWGASIEAVVVGSSWPYNGLNMLLTRAAPITAEKAVSLPPLHDWGGIMAATIHNWGQAREVSVLFQA